MGEGPIPQLSVVVATYQRPALLERLLRQLATQTLPPDEYEVVAVDDGSTEPVGLGLERLRLPYRLTLLRQANAGAAAARHRGVLRAAGELIVIVDDDMQVDCDFLEHHRDAHRRGRVAVLGRIRADPNIDRMPLFERWYARRLDDVAEAARVGRWKLRGNSLCTGNVSLRRADYLEVGGFDPALGRSEDSELGLRLKKAGVEMVFCYEAHTFHGSDHTRLDVWLRRAFLYGVFDARIARKHADEAYASPFRYLFRINPAARPLLGAALTFPRATRPVTNTILEAALALDRAGLEDVALRGVAVAYAMEYFRGVRDELGSLGVAARELAHHAWARTRPE